MTHRERLLAVFEERAADRVPYFPDLFYWYTVRRHEGRIPQRFRGLTLYDIYREIDCGICRHVYGDYVKVSYRNTEFRTVRRGLHAGGGPQGAGRAHEVLVRRPHSVGLEHDDPENPRHIDEIEKKIREMIEKGEHKGIYL